jgi:hypothetical protein
MLTSRSINKATGMKRYPVSEKGLSAAGLGDEADVLAVRLGGGAQAELLGTPPHFAFVHVTHGKQDPAQLILGQHVQHVGLVLGRIEAPAQLIAAAFGDDPGVVTGGDCVETQLVGPAQQAVELEMAVASDARIGRPSGRMVGNVRVDNVAVEVVGEVEDVVCQTQLLGDPAGVFHIGHRAAS